MKTSRKPRIGRTLATAICLPFLFAGLGDLHAAILQYEMTLAPDAEPVPMVRLGDGFGDAAAGDLLPTGVGGLQGNGTARLVDTGSHGKDGYYLTGLGATFTIDLRVQANSAVLPASGSDRRCMSICDDAEVGRGILIEPSGLTLVSGSGPVEGGTAAVDLSSLRQIRIVVSGNAAMIYDLDTDLDAGPGVNWAPLLAAPVNLGGSGWASEQLTGSGGGLSINTLDVNNGSTVQQSDYTLDWLRVDTGTDRGATGEIIPAAAPPACLAVTMPQGNQSISGMVNGIEPTPPPVPYTINNLGSSTINYTVSEIDTNLQPTDYDWLSLDKTSGSIAPAASDGFTATASTVGLEPGNRTAHLRIASGCSEPVPSLAEGFTYTHGSALVGNDGWTGAATETELVIDNGTVKYIGGGDTTTGDISAFRSLSFSSGPHSMYILRFKVMGGNVATDPNIWSVGINDDAGHSLGRFYGSPTIVAGRIGGEGVGWVTAKRTLSGPGIWDTLEIRVYPLSNQSVFFFNGQQMVRLAGDDAWRDEDGVLSHTPSNPNITPGETAGALQLLRMYNSGSASPVYVDDIEVLTSSDELRRIDLAAIGCDIRVQEPRLRGLSGCGSTAITTETFTIKNIGAYDWVGFQASEFSDDDDWLTLSWTSGPVARGGTAQVTATIDWSLVPSESPADDLIGVIRFSATCDGTNYVHDTPPDTIIVSAPPAQFVQYNGDVLPNQPDSGGPGSGISFLLVDDGSVEQGSIETDPDAVDGVAYHLVDSSTGKTRWQSNPAVTIDPRVGATVVARVKTLSEVDEPGANFSIFDQALTAALYWGGANGVIEEVYRGDYVTIAGDADYHYIRLTARDQGESTGIVVRAYVDELPDPVLTITSASGVNSGLAADGFGFGADDTGATQDIYFDCVWATNAGAFAPDEEVACLGRSLKCDSPCNIPTVDTDGDGDVDMEDFAELQRCITTGYAAVPALSQVCDCLDRNHDDRVDLTDVASFIRCGSGSEVPWEPTENCSN